MKYGFLIWTTTYPLITLILGIALLFGNGGSAFISRLLGSGYHEKAEVILYSVIAYSIATGILIQGALFFLPEILTFLGASKNVLPYALDYSKILFFSFLFHIPAVATGIAQFVAFSMLISHYISGRSILKFSMKKVKLKKWILIPIFQIGIPLFAINMFQSVSLGVANKFASFYGDATVAALGIVNRVIGMSTFAITGFSRGYQTFTSYNYGANNMERVNEATRIAVIWSLTGAVVLSAIQIIFASNIVNAFSDSPMVISKAIKAMFAGSIFFGTYGFQAIGVIFLLCIGENRAGFILSIARQGLLFIPCIFILNYFMGELGIFYAQGITDLITTILLIIYLKFRSFETLKT